MENSKASSTGLTVSNFHRRLFEVVNKTTDGHAFKHVRFEHRLKDDIGYITTLSATPDGSLLAVGSRNLAVIFDVAGETEVLRYKISSGKVASVYLCSTGSMLAIGTTGGEAIVYDLGHNKVLHALPHRSGVQNVHMSEDASLLAVASGLTARVYSINTGRLIREFTFDTSVSTVLLSSMSGRLSVELNSSAIIWDIETGERRMVLTDNGTDDLSCPVSDENLLIKSIGKDALMWDVRTGKLLRRFKHPENITGIGLSRYPAKYFTTSCEDGKARVFNSDPNPSVVRVLKHSDAVSSVYMTSDGKIIFTGCEAARAWEAGKGIKIFKGYGSQVIAACLTGDEQHLLVAGHDPVLKMYDLNTGRPVRRFEGHSSWISALALNEDKRIVATASHDNTACVFSLSGSLIHRLSGHNDCLHAVAISPDGKLIATAGRDQDIRIWDADSGQLKGSWTAHRSWVRSLVFDSNGKYLLSAGEDGMARLWETDGSRYIAEYGRHTSEAYSADFSPDGRFVLTSGHDGFFKIFNLDGTIKREFVGHVGGVRKVIFLSDGTLISVSLDCTARRWNPETGKCIQTYRGLHSDWIRTVCVRSDGVLILGSRDGAVSFSDLETGKHLATLHNIDRGFLWTTPPDDCLDSGWFWTDREDLIEVMEIDRECRSTLTAADSQDRKDHVSVYNSGMRVMSRIRNKGRDDTRFERLVDMHREGLGSGKYSVLLNAPDVQNPVIRSQLSRLTLSRPV